MTTTETNVRRGDIIRVTSLPSSEPLKIGDLPTDALALVFQWMVDRDWWTRNCVMDEELCDGTTYWRVERAGPTEEPDSWSSIWVTAPATSQYLNYRIRAIALVKPVCRGFRDAARQVLEKKDSEEAKAVERAKRAVEKRRKAEAQEKMRAELEAKQEAKHEVELVIRYVEESAKLKAKPEALTEATACPEVKNLRRHFRKGRLSELKMELREEEAKARDEARKACAVGRYHDRRWSDYLRWSGFLRSDPLDYMW